jgi:hypothetical protein
MPRRVSSSFDRPEGWTILHRSPYLAQNRAASVVRSGRSPGSSRFATSNTPRRKFSAEHRFQRVDMRCENVAEPFPGLGDYPRFVA